MTYQSPIRDLILRIDSVAMDHIAYPQVAAFMNHMRDHLSALAYAEEVNQSGPAVAALVEAADEFVGKVDRGEARSEYSYAAFKAALAGYRR